MQTEDSVAQFAALLRELKERTDRSYGSLGRRLHMNTSTLHRYCTGEAVPLDFAPVERFAALCGASGAERLELHRRWLLAVAARQRPHPTGPLGEAEGSDAPAGSQPGDSGSDDGGAPASGAAGGPADAEGLVSGPSPAPRRPRPWYRRKRAAAVVCAVLAAAGSLALLPDGGRDTDDGSRAASVAPETAAASAGPRASNTRSVSPSAGPKDGPASSPGTGREPSDPAGSTSAPAGSAPAGPPLAWSADSQAWAFGCGHDYVIAAPPERVPPLLSNRTPVPGRRPSGRFTAGRRS